MMNLIKKPMFWVFVAAIGLVALVAFRKPASAESAAN